MALTKNDSHSTSRRNFLKNSGLLGLGASLAHFPVPVMTQSGPAAAGEDFENTGMQKITLLYTADIHAQLFTHDEFFWENGQAVYRKRGGLAVLKSMIDHYRKENPTTILIDGGDYFHGSGLASLTEGKALIAIMNALNYDVIIPGNWEVVYKKEKMLYDMGHVNAAKICANMWHQTHDASNGELIFPPYFIKYAGGLKIGFIGYTDHLIPRRQSPAYSVGIHFEYADYNVARYIKLLREVEGCSLVFLVTHMGLAQQVGLADHESVQGADFILGADTHERLREPIQGKYTKVIECGAFGSFLGKLDLFMEKGKLKDYRYALLDVDPLKYKPDASLSRLIEETYQPFKPELEQVIGYSQTPLVRYFVLESPMDNMITDAIMWKFQPDIALSNGFRFCQPLAVPAGQKQVAITKGFLWNMLPVNSEAKQATVTGQQVWDWLERELENAFAVRPENRFGGWFIRYCGMEVNFTISNGLGKRVNWVKIGGAPIDLNKEYSIVACEREGDPDTMLCRMDHVKNSRRLGHTLHSIIEDYLKVHSPVAPKLERRSSATDAPHTLLTQLRGYSYEFS
jgi:2',3'-cyclic-nucleotide 2'-phosphodiesterase (5'-nucleotidase family)